MKLIRFILSKKVVTIILVIIVTIIAIIVRVISGNDPIGYLCDLLFVGGAFGLMGWTYEKAEDKSSIDWSQYSDLRRVRHTILIIQIVSYICYVLLIESLLDNNFVKGYSNDFEVN